MIRRITHRMNASDDFFGVPPEVIARGESLDVEPLLARIAAFAPPKYREQRERLFADLGRELHGDQEVQAALLSAIVRVHLPFPLNSPSSSDSPHRRTHEALSRARQVRGPRPSIATHMLRVAGSRNVTLSESEPIRLSDGFPPTQSSSTRTGRLCAHTAGGHRSHERPFRER